MKSLSRCHVNEACVCVCVCVCVCEKERGWSHHLALAYHHVKVYVGGAPWS